MEKQPVLRLTRDPSYLTNLIYLSLETSREQMMIFLKLKCVWTYNKVKKGVDIIDKMSSYHYVLRKGLNFH